MDEKHDTPGTIGEMAISDLTRVFAQMPWFAGTSYEFFVPCFGMANVSSAITSEAIGFIGNVVRCLSRITNASKGLIHL